MASVVVQGLQQVMHTLTSIVEPMPDRSGLQVRRVEDEVAIGDTVTVRVLGRNDRGQLRLTRKDIALPLAARAA